MEEEEIDKTKEIEDALISLIKQALKNNRLDIAHEHIMDILRSEYDSKCTDLWSMKYYLYLATPKMYTELEKLTQEYLDKINERYYFNSEPKQQVSYFSDRQLGIIDEAFDDWKKYTNHEGVNAKRLFVDWVKSNVNRLEER